MNEMVVKIIKKLKGIFGKFENKLLIFCESIQKRWEVGTSCRVFPKIFSIQKGVKF